MLHEIMTTSNDPLFGNTTSLTPTLDVTNTYVCSFANYSVINFFLILVFYLVIVH